MRRLPQNDYLGKRLPRMRFRLVLCHRTPQSLFRPCISAFVGADITCAILATDLCEKHTAMLADIGTNGEMALWHAGKLTVCSTAAGPAFEDVGISMGMLFEEQ